MKYKYLISIIAFVTVFEISTFGQGYQFSKRTEIYNNLTDAVLVNQGLWGYETYAIPIGFDFLFFDSYIDTLVIYENIPGFFTSNNLEDSQYIGPFGATLIDRGELNGISLSKISYKVLNDPGNRICIIEWKNFGFEGDVWCNNTSTDYVNFQVWLYEAMDIIEFHYGPNLITNFQCSFWGEVGPTIALSPWGNYLENIVSDSTIWLTGLAGAPSIILSNMPYYVTGIIDQGTIYCFNNVLTSTNDLHLTKVDIFPNPVKDVASVVVPDCSGQCNIEIYDLQGRLELKQEVNLANGIIKLSLEHISPGFKYMRIWLTNTYYSTKFIKL